MSKLKEILSTEISITKMKTIIAIAVFFIFFWVINLLFFKEAPESNQSMIEIMVKALSKGFQNVTE